MEANKYRHRLHRCRRLHCRHRRRQHNVCPGSQNMLLVNNRILYLYLSLYFLLY
jgi:hypothetical protein